MRFNLSLFVPNSIFVPSVQGFGIFKTTGIYTQLSFPFIALFGLTTIINLFQKLSHYLYYIVRNVARFSNPLPKHIQNILFNQKLHTMTTCIVSFATKRSLTALVFMLCFMFSMNLSAQFFNPNDKEFQPIELQSAKTAEDWKASFKEEIKSLDLALTQRDIQREDFALLTAQKAILDVITQNYASNNLNMISEAYKSVYNTLDESPTLKYTPKAELYNRCVAMIEMLSEVQLPIISKL